MALEKDGEVVGVGQFLLYNTAPVPGYLMYCTKGPWLPWDDEEAVRAFFRGARALARREGAHTVKIEPEVLERRKDVKALLGEIGFRKARYDLHDKTDGRGPGALGGGAARADEGQDALQHPPGRQEGRRGHRTRRLRGVLGGDVQAVDDHGRATASP